MQKEVDEWASQFKKPYFSPLSRMAALTEEIGDVLFSLVCTADAENIDLSQVWERKLEKVYDRDNSRFVKK